MSEYVIMHHGTKGMKWGVRKYQNPDGTYTQAGLKRYFGSDSSEAKRYSKTTAKYQSKIKFNKQMAEGHLRAAKAQRAHEDRLEQKTGKKTLGNVVRRAYAAGLERDAKGYARDQARAEKKLAKFEARSQKKVEKAMKKSEIKKAKQELKEAKKDLKTSEKLNRKAQKGILASRENMARQEASNKKMYKAEAKVLEKQAALGKAKGGEKGEMRVYMKAMHKTGLSGSVADVQSGGKATRTYDAIAAKKGRDYAQKIEKKVRNQKVAALAGGIAVSIGIQAVISYLESQNGR